MTPERKVALVIGNSAYAHASKLDAPRRDAIEVATLLERIGFSVVTGFDCDYIRFRDLAEDFFDRLDPQAVALFYYSGHGARALDGGNHMLPVDARLVDPRDLGRVTMPLNDILARMREKARVSLLLLDACRDDPFAALSRQTGTKSVFAGRPGLAAVPRANLGQALIGFAAEEGHTALDASGGRPSPFTAALVRHLPTPGRDIRDILGDVRKDVFAATDGRQTPWTKEALTDQVVLVPAPRNSGFGIEPRAPGKLGDAIGKMDVTPVLVSERLTPPQSGARRRVWLGVALALVLAATTTVSVRPRLLCGLPLADVVNACLLKAVDLIPLIPLLDSPDQRVRLAAMTDLSAAFGTEGIDEEDQLTLGQELLFAADLDRMQSLSPDGRYGLVFVLGSIPREIWRRGEWAATLKAATSLHQALSSALATGRIDIPVGNPSHLAKFGAEIGAQAVP